MEKQNLLVLFGGQSSEHEVSLLSATNIINHLDRERFELTLIGITRAGEWLLYTGPVSNLADGSWEKDPGNQPAWLLPDQAVGGVKFADGTARKIDAVFPVLHGLYGEDGTVQGLCKLAGIPCVGCSVAASAVSMDKELCKLALRGAGINQAPFVALRREELDDGLDGRLEDAILKLGLPIFVKPANAGSSVGITKAHDKEELKAGVLAAAEHDNKIILEKTIVGREIECAVLGNEKPFASLCGEVLPAKEFYDYAAKYHDIGSRTVVPAPVSKQDMENLRKTAVEVYRILGCEGFARVDFFLEEDGTVILNELNTIPGFTAISMYPMMMEHSGVPVKELLTKLVELAMEVRA